MSESLSLWNETPAKKAIINYVNVISNPESADFVPEAERIAVLDNDGTMWVEKPVYVQVFFVIDRLKQLAEADPTLLDQPHFKAAATGDLTYFFKIDPHAGGDIKVLMQIVFDSHAACLRTILCLWLKSLWRPPSIPVLACCTRT